MIQAEGITLGQADGIGWQGTSNALRQMDLKPCVFNTFEPAEFVELKSVGVNLFKTICFWHFRVSQLASAQPSPRQAASQPASQPAGSRNTVIYYGAALGGSRDAVIYYGAALGGSRNTVIYYGARWGSPIAGVAGSAYFTLCPIAWVAGAT